jgi:RNA polymerase sigma factor (sigma-70 family)
VNAFVTLTRRFQHLAFGSALALVHDFQVAEDVTQDAFLAAWSALPKLSDPTAFPGWLRSVVRHHAFRVLRRRQLNLVPLTEAAEVASEEPAADRVLDSRHQYRVALGALASLSPKLREPATLFYVHDCSHQDIAAFLTLSVTTVNNRLHAARTVRGAALAVDFKAWTEGEDLAVTELVGVFGGWRHRRSGRRWSGSRFARPDLPICRCSRHVLSQDYRDATERAGSTICCLNLDFRTEEAGRSPPETRVAARATPDP